MPSNRVPHNLRIWFSITYSTPKPTHATKRHLSSLILSSAQKFLTHNLQPSTISSSNYLHYQSQVRAIPKATRSRDTCQDIQWRPHPSVGPTTGIRLSEEGRQKISSDWVQKGFTDIWHHVKTAVIHMPIIRITFVNLIIAQFYFTDFLHWKGLPGWSIPPMERLIQFKRNFR